MLPEHQGPGKAPKEYRINIGAIDTAPGGDGPFAPGVGFSGDGAAYLSLMRERVKSDPALREALERTAWVLVYFGPAKVLGPYRGEVFHIFDRLRQQTRPADR